MAQVIAPEVWQEGIRDNSLLPGRYTTGLFTGNGVNIANNASACRVYDIQISDYITDYDDRRLNGLAGLNSEGHDGWGASAFGVFQDVRFDSRVYAMGRHRSVAFRLFEEQQYAGGIGEWGTASTSNVITTGESLMKVAQQMSKAKDLWQKTVLGPDIDKYNLFAVMNGHISGRWVAKTQTADYTDQIMDGDASHGQWVAQPGMVEGQALPPRFAPIHGIQWDDDNLPLLLQNIKVTWNELQLPENDRIILVDPFYEYRLITALTGNGVPVTEKGYADMQNGSFTRLMGWDFSFEIPSNYWPKLYFDGNLNVVHTADGQAAYDAIINSVNGGTGDTKMLKELMEANRMQQLNYVRTVWDNQDKKFKKVVTNYPLGTPTADGLYGVDKAEVAKWEDRALTGLAGVPVEPYYGGTETWPFAKPGAGYGLANPTGPSGDITLRQVIGCALFKKAAQLSQEYSGMYTDEGRTRGKFSEMAFDIKYDAWVIEQYSHGILPIVGEFSNDNTFSIPVSIVE